jgi:hypothetical protein
VELLKWAETYWNRQTSSSFAGHSRMFNNFPSTKFRLENREQATLLLADLRACTIALKSDEWGMAQRSHALNAVIYVLRQGWLLWTH